MKRLRSPDRRGYVWQEHVLKTVTDRKGYLGAFLHNNKIKKRMPVHRLVATAFVENPQNKPVVNHLDRNVKNNCVSNLEWCTLAENTAHAVKMGSFANLPTRKPVAQLSLSGNLIKEHDSIHSAARNTKLTVGNIGSACRRRKTAGGYMWLYKTDYAPLVER